MRQFITILLSSIFLLLLPQPINLADEDLHTITYRESITVDTPTEETIEVLGIVSLINQARKTPLKVSPFLTQSATIRACDMFEKQLWSHDGYTNYLWGSGYSGTDVGENLARHFNDDEVVYRAWLASPAHNEVMTYEKFRYIGIGHCGDYVVAHFGTTIR